MIAAVFDANVLVSGSGWRGEAHLCLVAMARRRVRVFTSPWIIEEALRICAELHAQGSMPANPGRILDWFRDTARFVTPANTGKQRSRDANDDPVLGTALAAKARMIVTGDKDLLVLEKPFGIEILRPRAFLAKLHRPV